MRYGRCENCKFWDGRDSFQGYVGNSALGECVNAKQLWDATEWTGSGENVKREIRHPDQKIFVTDASDYSASLITRNDFGCVEFEQREVSE